MSDDLPRAVIDVHIDTLEYTRQGLRMREPLAVEVGRHTRVRLIRPQRHAPVRVAASGFAHGSAFPSPGTLSVAWSLHAERGPFTHAYARANVGDDATFQVFGHACGAGDESTNKVLTDRRARVGRALLSSDADALMKVANEEGWGLAHAQAMLRTLAVNPGPTDGEMGRLTEAAMQEFAARYRRGIYHRHAPQPPKVSELPDDASWDDTFMGALLDAYTAAHGCAKRQDSIVRVAGCAAFNRAPEADSAASRRLSVIAGHGPLQHPNSAPCTDGDAGPCAIVDDHPQRCMWYREHVVDPPAPTLELFDPRWLWFGEDKYVLSVLTTAGEEQSFNFHVFEASDGSERPLGAIRDVYPILGTVSVVWRSEVDAEPDGRPQFAGLPSFRVLANDRGVSVDAPWTARTTVRVLIGLTDPNEARHAEVLRLWASDGSFDKTVPIATGERVSPQKVAVVFEDVPENALVNLAFGVEGSANYDIFRNVELQAMLENCSVGNACRELPPLRPPQTPAGGLPEHLDRVRHFEHEDEIVVHPPW